MKKKSNKAGDEASRPRRPAKKPATGQGISAQPDNGQRPASRAKLHADTVAAFLSTRTDKTFSFRELAGGVGAETPQERIQLSVSLDQLATAGRISVSEDGLISSQAEAQYIVGRIEHVNARFAYLVSESLEEDMKLATEDLNGAYDGDTVRVRISAKKRRGEWAMQGTVTEILQRGRTEYVGVIDIEKRFAFVVVDYRRMYEDIFVKLDDLNGAQDGDKVVVQITRWADAQRGPAGVVKEVLGPAGSHDTEMHAIMADFGLPYDFPAEIEKEAEAISDQITPQDLAERRDLREVTTFTIDPLDAKDFDDAISIRRLENGNWEIGVHIADVTHYVRPGTLLEREAYERATSVYLVDRVVPMLPERLSNGLCSLRPHENKLTFSAIFEIDDRARIRNRWFGRTIIHSDRRFTYEEGQECLENRAGDFWEELVTLNGLAKQLREARFRQGAIGFETVEVRFRLADDGTPLEVVPKARKDIHKLVEEFMLLANREVAEFVYKKKKIKDRLTMVYRVHESPDQDRLATFVKFAQRFGYKVNLEEGKMSHSLNQLITDVEGKAEQDILQGLAIRTMAKARYSTEPLGHFGLAFAHYSHFTSPIRRYPDMMAHRLLQHYLDGAPSADATEFELQCEHASERERRAVEAERASIKYKQVEFITLQDKHRTYEGIVSGVIEYGFFVEIIENKCEGMVRLSDLDDDHYELDAANFRIVGRRRKRVINFGDHVKVRVKEANLQKRIIDLVWVK